MGVQKGTRSSHRGLSPHWGCFTKGQWESLEVPPLPCIVPVRKTTPFGMGPRKGNHVWPRPSSTRALGTGEWMQHGPVHFNGALGAPLVPAGSTERNWTWITVKGNSELERQRGRTKALGSARAERRCTDTHPRGQLGNHTARNGQRNRCHQWLQGPPHPIIPRQKSRKRWGMAAAGRRKMPTVRV